MITSTVERKTHTRRVAVSDFGLLLFLWCNDDPRFIVFLYDGTIWKFVDRTQPHYTASVKSG